MLHTDFVYKVPIPDAIGWQLYKTDLSNELTDRAEQEAIEKGVTVDGIPFREADCYSDIKSETEGNVVSFIVRWKNWRDDLDNGDEIKIDTGDNEIGTSVTIQTIRLCGEAAEILTKEGERIFCLRKQIV